MHRAGELSRRGRIPPGAKTKGQSSDGLEPYFGLRPHDPEMCVRPTTPAPCPTCGGSCRRERSGFVCMGCHGVAPSRERKYAQQRRDDELATIKAAAAKKSIKFVPKLTKKQRKALVAEYGAEAEAWLAEIDGNPAA